MLYELRHAIRALLRDRGFTLMVVLSLALGIGANTAIFSLVNGVLLRPVAFPNPDRLVAADQIVPKFAKAYPLVPINIGQLMEWRREARSFESIGVMQPESCNLTGAGEPELLTAARVSANIFTVLGIQPRLGRTFLESEDPKGHDRVAIISDALWRRRFQADPGIVGRAIFLDGRKHEIVGVLPAAFRFPSSAQFAERRNTARADVFRPLGYESNDVGIHIGEFNFWATARLRPGVSIQRATSELNAIQAAINSKFPQDLGLRASLQPLSERVVGDSRRGLLLLMAAVGAVLLVLWVNLANLSLVRAAGQTRDSAIRTALGAGRWRLVRHSMAESLLLALTGGTLGVGLAYGGLRALVASAPIDLPRLNEVRVDLGVLLFALGVSLAAGILLGLLPAMQRAVAKAPYEALKSGSHSTTVGKHGMRVRNSLVSLEVGLSVALLVVAGLLASSFTRLISVDKGFDVERVIALDMALNPGKYGENAQRAAFFQRVLEKTAVLPGVQSAALISALPLQGETWIDIVGTEKDPRPMMEQPTTNVRFVSPGYFKTLHVPFKAGRDFEEGDRRRQVAIISANLAAKIWPGQEALGRKLDDGGRLMEVVGITPDFRSTSLDKDPVNILYIPYWQRPRLSASLLVRTGMDPRGLASILRKEIWSADPDVPIPEVRTMEEVMSHSVAQRRFQMLLVVLFAAAALGLAAFGTYGVVSYAVASRRAEMGIRMALGARPTNLVGMVLGQGMGPVIAGLAMGGLAALALGRYLSSLLFEVSPRDPVAFAGAAVVLLAVAAAACLIPARRATRVTPMDALRFE